MNIERAFDSLVEESLTPEIAHHAQEVKRTMYRAMARMRRQDVPRRERTRRLISGLRQTEPELLERLVGLGVFPGSP